VFKLDLEEKFVHLSRAPIVEAVIEWKAKAQTPLDTDEARAKLMERLPDFESCEPVQKLELSAMLAVPNQEGAAPVVQQLRALHGYRLTSADRRHVVQINREGVAFSRLSEYEDWDRFSVAAKRVWRVFVELAAPLEIQRLGVRFINQIAAATPETLAEYLREPPTCPSNLPLNEFVYQSTFRVPNEPFNIRVVKLMQSSPPDATRGSGLFVDNDVYTVRPIPIDDEAVDQALLKMRWLKNKIFFSLLTDRAAESFM